MVHPIAINSCNHVQMAGAMLFDARRYGATIGDGGSAFDRSCLVYDYFDINKRVVIGGLLK